MTPASGPVTPPAERIGVCRQRLVRRLDRGDGAARFFSNSAMQLRDGHAGALLDLAVVVAEDAAVRRARRQRRRSSAGCGALRPCAAALPSARPAAPASRRRAAAGTSTRSTRRARGSGARSSRSRSDPARDSPASTARDAARPASSPRFAQASAVSFVFVIELARYAPTFADRSPAAAAARRRAASSRTSPSTPARSSLILPDRADQDDVLDRASSARRRSLRACCLSRYSPWIFAHSAS